MKFLEKMKNLFTEEVEEVVEDKSIKKEVKQVEIASPISRREDHVRVDEPKISDSVILNNTEKSRTPIYFDDKDFADLERPLKKVEEVKPKIKQPEPTPKPYQPVIQEKKVFKPSPIISPVYGVLDQNYTKDDIVPKRESSYYSRPKKLTIDDVRKKAYGSLEDELEDTLYGRGAFLSEENDYVDVNDSLDLFDENKDDLIEDNYKASHEQVDTYKEDEKSDDDLALEIEKQKAKLEEINKYIKSNVDVKEDKKDLDNMYEEEKAIPSRTKSEQDYEDDLDDIEKRYEPLEEKSEVEKELDSLEEEINKDIGLNKDKKDDSLEEGDLFNLIDSMYEKGE